MARDPETIAHLEWLGYVQPVGLVVSIPALLQAQAYINRNIAPEHQRFLAALSDIEHDKPLIKDFHAFTQSVLGWDKDDLIGATGNEEVPSSLEVLLPVYGETLRPTYAVREFKPKDDNRPWLLLIQELPNGTDLDEVATQDDRHWQAGPQSRFERLLRETQVPTGLLFNGIQLRLVYAPNGESSGHITFAVADMASVAGRPIFAALHMLLCAERLFSLPERQRLPAILADSRKYQNVVSTKLAEQVLAALYELLRGFQAADDARKGELLRDVLTYDPNHVYAGLLTVLMRTVFVLFAEDRGLLSTDSVYANYYSVTGLFDRLRADSGRYPDTMDQRYGAWAQLLTLFRLVYDGGSHGGFRIPGRKGYLFDPDRYSFLEGHSGTGSHAVMEPGKPLLPNMPRVSDGVIFRVLSNLLILDGERLSYRTLDVEQIGSVYEAIMGFRLEIAGGRSIGIKPVKRHGAPATINLEALLDVKPADRAKWLKENTDQKFEGKAGDGLKSATTIEGILVALDKKIARHVTPNVVPKGAMVLQPSDERRRSGSHYTPRSLTEPIVRKTLEPILKRLGDKPTPEQLLDLKICDMACGSGAFLVEASRQLGDELVKAWHVHNCLPKIPPDEDELLHARRIIAQRCLYGVDKNAMAVDLAKLSLWLATLAKDHPFTFLDHSLRAGDSLIGLTRQQIADFHWQRTKERRLGQEHIEDRIKRATQARKEILDAGDALPPEVKAQRLAVADDALEAVRFFGDLCIAAFFAGDKEKMRLAKREEYLDRLTVYLQDGSMTQRPTAQVMALHNGERPIIPFHWEIEFPEVFARKESGFDAIVGNPPFFAGAWLRPLVGAPYRCYLVDLIARGATGLRGTADLCSYFLLRAASLLHDSGFSGLVMSGTIAEGDSKEVGTEQIVRNGCIIYSSHSATPWPGDASVEIVKLWFSRSQPGLPFTIDEVPVDRICPDLTAQPLEHAPEPLAENEGLICKGHELQGDGFKVDKETAAAIAHTHPPSKSILRPLLIGEDLNETPEVTFGGYVINMCRLELHETARYPALLEIVRTKVKPERDAYIGDASRDRYLRMYWWKLRGLREEIEQFAESHAKYLACTVHTKYLSFSFVPSTFMATPSIYCVLMDSHNAFAVLQSNVHAIWAFKYGSSLGDTLRYVSGRCFDTFPFPDGFQADRRLQAAGNEYYEFRVALMIRNNEGLTKTYNRFHDPNETSPDIDRLRELHAAMDRAVLDAYGWTDIQPKCEFLLDYEEDDGEDGDVGAARSRGRKKPWRYRWPDEVRDEVLARLLALNAKRAEQEQLSGAAAKAVIAKPKKATVSRGREPELALFDTAYPATETDRTICAASLHAVEKAGGIGSMDHLDVLLLVTHKDWCPAFLDTSQKKKFDRVVRAVPTALFVGTSESIKWKECRDYLETRNAICVDHVSTDQRITVGQQLSAMKAEFPGKVQEVIDLALLALHELQRLRQNAASATKEQQKLLAALKQQEQAFGLAVA